MNNSQLDSSFSTQPQTLKVVSPQKRQPLPRSSVSVSPASQPAQQENSARCQPRPKSNPLTGWLTAGGILLIIGAIGFIEIPNYVTGEAKIISRKNARQQLAMPTSGRVTLRVEDNQKVYPNEIIAVVQSDELDNQIAEMEREWVKAKQGLTSIQQQLIVAESRLLAAQNNEAIVRERAQRQRAEIDNPTVLPQIRRLESEKAAIPQEIEQIEAEIAAILSDISGLQAQVLSAVKTVNAYEFLQLEGATRSKDLWDARAQKEVLEAQIRQRENFIEAKRRQIQQKESGLVTKSEQINEVGKQSSDLLYNTEEVLMKMRSETQTAQKEVEKITAEIQTQQQLVQQWEAGIEQRTRQREQLTIRAEQEGTAVTSDLDLKNNLRLEAGREFLQIVDLRQLTAEVLIRQEDKDFVKAGAKVKFYQQGGTVRYSATVENEGILPVVQTEEKQQKPMLKVRISIDNEKGSLLPGVDGYAHIETERLRVHQKVGHEFNKLFNFGKYFPWLPE